MLKKHILIIGLLLSLVFIWAQGSEDFSLSNLTASYANGSFVGNDGFTWTYGHSRNPDVYPIEDEGLMLRRASDSYLMATIPGGIGSFSFQYRKAFTGVNPRVLELLINDVQVGVSEEFGTVSGADPTVYTFTLEDINAPGMVQLKIKLVGNSATNAQCVIDNLIWSGFEGGETPTIFITGALASFTTIQGGPSLNQSYSVSGITLRTPIQITAPDGFEISLDEENYQTTLNLYPVDGEVDNTPIFVRLTGATEGTYEGNITHSSTNADTKYMPVQGTVFPLAGEGYYVDFEGDGETKTSYASGTVNLSGLDWNMTDVLIGTDAADFKNGLRSARFRGYGTSSFTMLEDKANGLGTISFLHRKYDNNNDGVAAWIVEYSTDGGNQWEQIGETFTATAEVQSFSEEVNVGGNVRIRFRTEETGSSNKRMCMDDILLTDYAGGDEPAIFISGSLSEFSTFVGTASASQSYSLSGAALTGNIVVNAPTGFQLSTNNETFANYLNLPPTFSGNVYVRLHGGTAGEFTGNINHISNGAETQTIPVSGSVLPATPTISLDGSLPIFNAAPGVPSSAGNYIVEGNFLTAPIQISAPQAYQLSLTQNGDYSSTLSLYPVAGVVAETTIYVRLFSETAGTFYGNISHSSAGAETVNMPVNGNVQDQPTAIVLMRPAQISLADIADESAVLMKLENYPTDDVRFRLYNGSNQYRPWNAATGEWVSATGYAAGPQVPGDATTQTTWWIVFQRGNNESTIANYRDRLGPGYATPNFQTQALPAATAIETAVNIEKSQVNFSTWNDFEEKHVVLAYDAEGTLIAAASTALETGDFTILVEMGTQITRIEVRDVLNNLLETVTGSWPTELHPEIIVSGEVDPLINIAGAPSEEYGFYQLSGIDLVGNIQVQAPLHFQLSIDAENWASELSLDRTFAGDVYVRIFSSEVGEHDGVITHNSAGAAEKTIRVEGETIDPPGVINVDAQLEHFIQEIGTPSAAQSYSLSSSGLDSNISITAGEPFELSTDLQGWNSALSVSPSFNGLVYVRMNATTLGEYESIEIKHTHHNATPKYIYVSGEITIPSGPVDNLFFSEYIEGSSNNKAIEIFNASAFPVNLNRYQVELYSNGSASAGNTLALSGVLEPGEVYVIANDQAAAEIQNVADVTSTVTYFNGDDALVLRCLNPDTIIDVIGQVGDRPAAGGWDVAGEETATLNHTIVRKSTVSIGNTDWESQQGTNADDSEWIVYPVDTFEYLGDHEFASGDDLEIPVVNITQSGNMITLSWDAIAGATSYRIEASDEPDGDFQELGTASGTTFSTPANATRKFYRVIALP